MLLLVAGYSASLMIMRRHATTEQSNDENECPASDGSRGVDPGMKSLASSKVILYPDPQTAGGVVVVLPS